LIQHGGRLHHCEYRSLNPTSFIIHPTSPRLQNGRFSTPRNGKKNDNAHPPIHPTAHAANLAGDEKKVYEFITRRFLASCAQDALGYHTTVDLVCGEEEFYVTGEFFAESFCQ
jgi:DNA topoisomerase III